MKSKFIIAACIVASVQVGHAVDTVGDEKFPRTASYDANPLFVDLSSPMVGGGTGPLYTADPSARVWNIDGREVLYLYASHDMEPPRGCDYMDRYHIFSTEDLVNWIDYGEVLDAETSNRITGIGSDGFMWAPDCGYNKADGKYYFIYPHKLSNVEDVWGIFVGVSENPAGPFDLKGYIKGVPSVIDPCLFVDDDGQPYLYVGGGGKGCWGGKLRKDDWTKLDGEMRRLEGFEDFHEGPWVHKYNGKYYLSHPDNNHENNRLRYSVGDSPLGPFKPMGIYMHAHGHDTSHGSIVKFKGKWYQFYHTADYSGKGNLRSVCFDELTYGDNGTINMVNTWGSPFKGKAPVLSVSQPLVIEAVNYNEGGNSKGYFTRTKVAPDRSAGSVDLGPEEWLRFSIATEQAGQYTVKVLVKALKPGATLSFLEDVEYLTDMHGISLPEGSDRDWTELSFPVTLQQGDHFVELRVKQGDVSVKNFIIERK